jgi:hypothetical protein
MASYLFYLHLLPYLKVALNLPPQLRLQPGF